MAVVFGVLLLLLVLLLRPIGKRHVHTRGVTDETEALQSVDPMARDEAYVTLLGHQAVGDLSVWTRRPLVRARALGPGALLVEASDGSELLPERRVPHVLRYLAHE